MRYPVFFLSIAAALLALVPGVSAQSSLLQAGPLVGYVAPFSARLWVQTRQSARVWVAVRDSAGSELLSDTVLTAAADAYVAHLRVAPLRPATTYTYQLWLDGRPLPLPYSTRFRTPPAPGAPVLPDFTFATGSCALVTEPYDAGTGYGIFESIRRQQPDMMVWLGDNVYLNKGEESDLAGRRRRYAHTRALPQLQPLLANTGHVAIWDDHDFGANDADRTSTVRRDARATFDLFWANPPAARPQTAGLTTKLQWVDADFFLLDNRSFRSAPKTPRRQRTQLGADQISWLLRELRTSRATFKFVATGGQVLSANRRGEAYASHFRREQRRLLDSLATYRIPGVVFLTGDRHFTELTRWQRRHRPVAYDLTVSPFTSPPVHSGRRNRRRVRGTLVQERNFATVRVAGPPNARTATVTVFDAAGQMLWSRRLDF